MKKKIFRALTLGLIVGGVGFISSCKDYDEDLRTEMSSQIDQKIDEKVQGQIEQLKKDYESLQVVLQGLCKCEETKPWKNDLADAVSTINTTINNKFAELEGKIPTADQIRDIVTAMGYYTPAEVDAMIKNLQDQIDALGKGGDVCTCDLDAFKTALLKELDNVIEQKITSTVTKDFILNLLGKEYSDMLNTYITAAELDNYVTKDALAAQITGIATNAQAISQLQQTLKDLEARVKAAEETLKTHGEDIETLKKLSEDLKKADEELASKIKEAKELAETAQKAAEAAQKTADEAVKAAETAQKAAEAAQQTADANAQEIAKLKQFKEAWEATLNEWKLTIPVLTTAVEGLTARVEALENRVAAVEDRLTQVSQRANDAYEKAESNYTLISNLTQTVKDLTSVVEGNSTAISDIQKELATKASLDDLKEVKTYAEQIKAELDKLINDVRNLEGFAAGIDDKIDQHIDDCLKEILPRIDKLESQVDANTKAIASLVKDIEALKKMITSIEIQGTTNPLFGSIYLPWGVQTNVVALWYGEALNDGKFPSYGNNSAYIWENQAMDDNSIAGDPRNDYYEYVGGDLLMDESEGNAGTIYTTINPTSVDFTGVEFSLVNSLDEKSAFELGTPKASEERLKFGFTRAASNGFYEAPVTLKAADVKKVNVKISDNIKDAVQDVVDNVTTPKNINTNKIANVIKDQLDYLSTDALGLKSWVASENRGVYSKYAIAGVSIKNPISYASFKDFNYTTVPGYQRAINLINRAANTVKDRIKFNIGGKIIDDINAIDIKHIEINPLTDAQKNKFNIKINKDITISGLQYHLQLDQDISVPVVFDQNVDVTVPAQTVNVSVPALNINTTAQTAELQVKVFDAANKEVGTATIPVQTVSVTGTTENKNLTVTIPGQRTDDVIVHVNQMVNTTVHIDKLIKLDDYTYTFTYENDLSADIAAIFDPIVAELDKVNTMLDQLQNVKNDANDLLDQINSVDKKISDAADEVADQLKSYIEKVNNKLVSLVNSVNDKLQPFLLSSDDNGTHMLSGAMTQASKINSSTTFYASNYFAEVIAPAFKRHMAVVNVYNPDGSKASNAKSLAQAVNNSGDMNKVLEGSQIEIKASGFQKDYVYEVAYSALDYTGKQVTQKYYVRVK